MKGILFLAALTICFCSCNQKPEAHRRLTPKERVARQDSLKGDLLKTDLAFSELSEAKGRNAAFLEYADSGATMLRAFSMPTTGKDGIAKLLAQFPDSNVKVTWVPVYSDVALSGDLGYTYGTYNIESKTADNFGGTYCTIWKRSKANGWKFILSSGNEGVKPND